MATISPGTGTQSPKQSEERGGATAHVLRSPVTHQMSKGFHVQVSTAEEQRRIEIEASRQLKKANEASHTHGAWVLNPESPYRQVWDLAILLLIIYQVMIVPYRIAFTPEVNTNDPFFIADCFIDVVFFGDIILNFRTGYYNPENEEHIILDPNRIFENYVEGWFPVDAVACLPIDLGIALATNSGTGAARYGAVFGLFKVLRVVRLAKLVKLIRLFRLGHMLNTWEEKLLHITINPGLRRLTAIFFYVLIIAHVSGCLWYFVCTFEADALYEDSWFADYYASLGYVPADISMSSRYLTSIYWSITALTGVGFGDIVAKSDRERAYAAVVMLAGSLVYGYIIGNMSSIVANLNHASTLYNAKMDSINSYLRYKKVPHELQVKIRKYFRYYLGRKTVFDEKGILDELSHYLRAELSMFLIKDVLGNTELFDQSDPIFMSSVVTMLKPFSAIPGDYIIHEGEIGFEMYILVSGHVEVVSGDGTMVYAVLGPGNHFGEIAPIVPTEEAEKRSASVRAIDYCDLFSLHKDDLDEVLINFPEISDKLLEIARTRINITRNLRKDKMAKIHVRPGPKTSSLLLSPASMASMQVSELNSTLREASSFGTLGLRSASFAASSANKREKREHDKRENRDHSSQDLGDILQRSSRQKRVQKSGPPARKTSAGSTESSPARTVRRGQSFVGRRISSTSTASSSSPSGDTRPRRTTLVKGLTSEHRDSFVQIQALKKKLQGDIKSKQKTQITTLVRDDIDPAVLAGISFNTVADAFTKDCLEAENRMIEEVEAEEEEARLHMRENMSLDIVEEVEGETELEENGGDEDGKPVQRKDSQGIDLVEETGSSDDEDDGDKKSEERENIFQSRGDGRLSGAFVPTRENSSEEKSVRDASSKNRIPLIGKDGAKPGENGDAKDKELNALDAKLSSLQTELKAMPRGSSYSTKSLSLAHGPSMHSLPRGGSRATMQSGREVNELKKQMSQLRQQQGAILKAIKELSTGITQNGASASQVSSLASIPSAHRLNSPTGMTRRGSRLRRAPGRSTHIERAASHLNLMQNREARRPSFRKQLG